MDYVDVRCFQKRPYELDDTCRLKRAASAAAARVLWIPTTLSISPKGERVRWYGQEAPCYEGSPSGIRIRSGTMVAGGGTIKLKVFCTAENPAVDDAYPNYPGYEICSATNPVCDPDHGDRLEPEICEAGSLLRIEDASNVTIRDITLDGNASELQCPDHFYPGYCEHRHAISIIGGSSDVVVGGLNDGNFPGEPVQFRNLVGDGVYIDDTWEEAIQRIPTRIVILGNDFSAYGGKRNRNGVSIVSGTEIRIDTNHFDGMGRGYLKTCPCPPSASPPCFCPESMPGPIDLEPDHGSGTPGINRPYNKIERVRIANNTMIGWDGCFAQAGIGLVNQRHAILKQVDIDHNVISGCFQSGILVSGSGVSGGEVFITGNTIRTTRPDPVIVSRWGIRVEGHYSNVDSLHPQVPSYAYVNSNTIDGLPPDPDSSPFPELPKDGVSMIGINMSSSQTIVARNRVFGAGRAGIYYDAFFTGGPPFQGTNTFCSNLLCGNGNETSEGSWLSGMLLWGSSHVVQGNIIKRSPRAVTIWDGFYNQFLSNTMSGISSCSNIGCIHCYAAGCQNFDSNTGGPVLTNCSTCSGGEEEP